MLDASYEERREIYRAETTGIDIRQAVGLIECFQVLERVMTGFSCQPRFLDEKKNRPNAAGALIQEIEESFAQRAEVLTGILQSMSPNNSVERDDRARMLIKRSVSAGNDLPEIAATAAALAVPERH